ncbi:MAG TPA: hypothetical protein DHU65_02795 [Clostridiales bacterium]|nr:hypothetical protein [Clostridiales bacterium]
MKRKARLILCVLFAVLASASMLFAACNFGDGAAECEHLYGEWKITVPATCSKEGEQKRVCSRCNNEETMPIAKIAHTIVHVEEKAATCDEAGYKAYDKCSVCDYTEGYEAIPALGHNYGEATYAWSKDYSTCVATRVCGRDNSHVDTESVTVTATVVQQKTCTQDELTKYTATFTGELGSDEKIVTTKTGGHELVNVPAKAATCEEPGYKAYVKCANCDYTEDYEELPALGHNYGGVAYVWNADYTVCKAEKVCSRDAKHVLTANGTITKTVVQEKTCTQDELTKYTATFESGFAPTEKTVTTKKAGHDLTDVSGKAATCTETGYKAYKKCKNCDYTEGYEEIPVLGHDYDYSDVVWNADYTACSVNVVCKNDASHNFTVNGTVSKKVIKEATCTEDGEIKITATFENGVPAPEITVAVSKKGHKLTHYEAIPATCEKEGREAYDKCDNCDYTVGGNAIPKLGHNYGEATYVWSTDYTACTATRVCSNDESHVLTVNATVTKIVVQEKTCTQDEITKYAVAIAFEDGIVSDEKTVVTQKAGHELTVMEGKAATCEEDGYKSYKKCVNCDYAEEKEVIHALGHNFGKYEKSSEVATGNACEYTVILTAKCSRCDKIDSKTSTIYKHEYREEIVKAATCAEEGLKHKICKNCDAVYGENYSYSDPEAHSWDEGTVNEKGYVVYSCTTCGATKTQTSVTTKDEDGAYTATVKAESKNEVSEIRIIETENEKSTTTIISLDQNTRNGLNGDITLSAKSYNKEELPKLTEELKEKIGESKIYNFTMTAGGESVTKFEGSVTITIDHTLAPGEDPDNIVVWWIADDGTVESIKATYSEGKVTFTTTHFSYYVVAKTTAAEKCKSFGHDYLVTETEPATCETAGYTVKVCSVCGDSVVETIPAKGHKVGGDGNCKVCGKHITDKIQTGFTETLKSLLGGELTVKFNNVEMEMWDFSDLSLDSKFFMNFAELYIGVSADGEVSVYGYGVGYYTTKDLPKDTFRFEATLAIDSENFYLKADIPMISSSSTSDYLGKTEWFKVNGMNQVIPLSSMVGSGVYQMMNGVLPETVKWMKAELIPAIENVIDLNDSAINSVIETFVNNLFTSSEAEGNAVYTLDADKLKAVAEVLINGSVKDVFEYFAGEGSFETFTEKLKKLLDMPFGEMLENAKEKGINIKAALTSVNGLLAKFVPEGQEAQADIVAIISNMATKGQMTMTTAELLEQLESEDFRSMTLVDVINMMASSGNGGSGGGSDSEGDVTGGNEGKDNEEKTEKYPADECADETTEQPAETKMTSDDIINGLRSGAEMGIVEIILNFKGQRPEADQLAEMKKNYLSTANQMIDVLTSMVNVSFTLNGTGEFVKADVDTSINLANFIPEQSLRNAGITSITGKISVVKGKEITQDYAAFLKEVVSESEKVSSLITDVIKDYFKGSEYEIVYNQQGYVDYVEKTYYKEENLDAGYFKDETSLLVLLEAMSRCGAEYGAEKYAELYKQYGEKLNISFRRVSENELTDKLYFGSGVGGYMYSFKKTCGNKYSVSLNTSSSGPIFAFGSNSGNNNNNEYYYNLVVTLSVDDTANNRPSDIVYTASMRELMSVLEYEDTADNIAQSIIAMMTSGSGTEITDENRKKVESEIRMRISDVSDTVRNNSKFYNYNNFYYNGYSYFPSFTVNADNGSYVTEQSSNDYRICHNDVLVKDDSHTPANCAEWGWKSYKCADCGEVFVKYYRTGHKHVTSEVVFDDPENPNCTTGVTVTYTCTDCNQVIYIERAKDSWHVYLYQNDAFDTTGLPEADHKHTMGTRTCVCGKSYGGYTSSFESINGYYKKGEDGTKTFVSGDVYICRECDLGFVLTADVKPGAEKCTYIVTPTYKLMQLVYETEIGMEDYKEVYETLIRLLEAKVSEINKEIENGTYDGNDDFSWRLEEARYRYAEAQNRADSYSAALNEYREALHMWESVKDTLGTEQYEKFAEKAYPVLKTNYGVKVGEPYTYERHGSVSESYELIGKTCEEGYYVIRTCSDCGKVIDKRESHGHRYDKENREIVGSNDVCYRIVTKCEICGEILDSYERGHKMYVEVGKALNAGSDSCEDGWHYIYRCDECGATFNGETRYEHYIEKSLMDLTSIGVPETKHEHYWYTCLCGGEINNIEGFDNWCGEYILNGELVNKELKYCSECKIGYILTYESSDENCLYTERRAYTFVAISIDEETNAVTVLKTYGEKSSVYSYESHNEEVVNRETFNDDNGKGEGYILTYRCNKCGRERTETYYGHYFGDSAPEYKLLGKTCEDGVEVTRRCLICGEAETHTEYKHFGDVKDKVTLEGKYCTDGVKVSHLCSICECELSSETYNYHMNYQCGVELTAGDDTDCKHVIFGNYCSDCGYIEITTFENEVEYGDFEVYNEDGELAGYASVYCKNCAYVLYRSVNSDGKKGDLKLAVCLFTLDENNEGIVKAVILRELEVKVVNRNYEYEGK